MNEVNQRTLLYTVDLYDEKIFHPVSALYADLFSNSELGRLRKSFFGEGKLEIMEVYRLHKYLRGKLAINEYISEIHFYSKERHEMISTRFGYKSGNSLDFILENMNVSSKLDESTFPVVTSIFSYVDDTSYKYYNMIYPSNMLGGKLSKAEGFMIFTLDANKISTLINNQEGNRIYIIGKEGEVLCAHNTDMIGKVSPLPFDLNSDISVFFEDDMVISWVRSSVGDIFFGSETLMEGFYPAVGQMISRMLFITAVLLFLGFLIAFWMSGYVAKPIMQVAKQMADTIQIKGRGEKRDLEEIASTICNEFHTLEDFIKRNRETIKSNYILNLYLNQSNRISELEGKKTYIEFMSTKHYIPALFLCTFKGKINEEARQMALYKYIYDLENNQSCQQIIAAEVEDNIIAVIYNGISERDFEEQLIRMMEEMGNESIVCYGNSCEGEIQIGEMFQSLKEMLPYRYFYPSEKVFRLKDFFVSQSVMDIDITKFEKDLKALEVEECLNKFQTTLQAMEEQKLSYENRQKVLVLFVSSVTEVACSRGICLETKKNLLESKDIRQFCERFELHLNEFKDISLSRQKSKKQDEIDKIKNFIALHYDCDISLSMIGEEMNMNPSYISRFFKEMTGQNITEYIKNIKLEKAEKLLLTTEYSVESIAQMMGYNTTHYFIRHFKEKYGSTPIMYKKEKMGKYRSIL